VDPRTGRKGQLFLQSTFGGLGGYEDVNDADRLGHDPAMQWMLEAEPVGRGIQRSFRLHLLPSVFLFNQFGGLEQCPYVPATCTVPTAGVMSGPRGGALQGTEGPPPISRRCGVRLAGH
jgi:hypothetical protein